MTLKCVIQESIKTYSKLIKYLMNLWFPLGIIGFIISVTIVMIYLLKTIEKHVKAILSVLYEILNLAMQYLISIPAWIWLAVIGLWVSIGAVPAYSYVKCKIRELPEDIDKDELFQGIIAIGILSSLIGTLVGSVLGAIIYTTYHDDYFGWCLVMGSLLGGCIGTGLELISLPSKPTEQNKAKE
jgi:MFS family permease